MNILSGFGHGWHNVVDASGGTITLTGMLLVFSSLALISVIIGLTPYLLKVVDRIFPETAESEPVGGGSKAAAEAEMAAAIGTAMAYSMKTSKM